MTGEEHYREAERLVDLGLNQAPADCAPQREAFAAAQVHATLALAAAQSYVPAEHGYPARERYGAVTR